MLNKLRIKKLGILSVAKMYALIMFIMSLLIAVPYGLVIIIISLIGGVGAGSESAMGGLFVGGGGILMGIFVLIGIPLFYAVIGFIAGALGALIYNILSGMVGGIEIEVENIN